MRVFKTTGMDRNNKKNSDAFSCTHSVEFHIELYGIISVVRKRIDNISNSEYICLQEC